MRRRITAAWVLPGLMAAASAHAQQEIPTVVYGVLDIGVGQFQTSGLQRQVEVRSGQMAGSRIGVSGKEDLGDGLTASVVLESFMRLDTGAAGRNDADPFWSREAALMLSHNRYGSVRVGRMATPLFDSTSRFNAFGAAPGYSPAMRHTFSSGVLESVQGDLYWSSGVAYISPNLEGFTLKVMRTVDPDGANNGNAGASVTYSRGLIALAATAVTVRVDPRQPEHTHDAAWQLAGSYNAGLAKVFALYGQTQDTGFDVASKTFSLGAIVRLGEGNVLVQFAQTNAQGEAIDRKHQTFSLAYDYELSKRQDVYVVMMRDQVRRQPTGLTIASGMRYLF
jgi:predicted porin